MDAKIVPPEMRNGIYILPASGEYEIRVLQPRSQARKDKKPQYWMSINIK